MRHAGFSALGCSLCQSPSARPSRVGSTTFGAALVTPCSLALVFAAGCHRAGPAAVALPPVTRPAQQHRRVAVSTKVQPRCACSQCGFLSGNSPGVQHLAAIVDHLLTPTPIPAPLGRGSPRRRTGSGARQCFAWLHALARPAAMAQARRLPLCLPPAGVAGQAACRDRRPRASAMSTASCAVSWAWRTMAAWPWLARERALWLNSIMNSV